MKDNLRSRNMLEDSLDNICDIWDGKLRLEPKFRPKNLHLQ